MTNIIEKNKNKDVHLHIDIAYQQIENNLPIGYVDKVLQKLKHDPTISKGIIRNVKNRISQYPLSRIPVLNALVEVAQEYQKELETLKESISR